MTVPFEALFAQIEETNLQSLLDDWRWLVGDRVVPLHASLFGDLLLRRADGSIAYLDVAWGTIEIIATSEEALERLLRTTSGREDYLRESLAAACLKQALRPGPDECLDFAVPPSLSGRLHPSNVRVMSLSVSSSVLGQVHEQTVDLPPGTSIEGFGVKR